MRRLASAKNGFGVRGRPANVVLQSGRQRGRLGRVTLASAERAWRKGRGKLGILDPLLGDWEADADSPLGAIHCMRAFRRVLGGKYVQLAARWELPGQVYEELALFGVDDAGNVAFWSVTSDGKRSHGVLAAAPDVHPQTICFEAQMPAGRRGRVLVGRGIEDEGGLEPVRRAPLPGAGGRGRWAGRVEAPARLPTPYFGETQ
ncbi:MAG: hypothetical protein ACM30E_08510 [Nitrososphaerales archaeon]